MAFSNYIPEIWEAQLLQRLYPALKYAQPGLINRDYEGDIAQAGDTVHITSLSEVTVDDYVVANGVTYGTLSDVGTTFVIAQQKYFAFKVDDINKRQALKQWPATAMRSAAFQMAKAVDSYVSGIMVAGVAAGTAGQGNEDGVNNKLGSVTVQLGPNSGNTLTTGDIEAYTLMLELSTKLDKANCPEDGRFVVVPPDLYAQLLQDRRFIEAQRAGTTEGLRNGNVGSILGFDVIKSNTVPSTSGVFHIVAGHGMATTYADQLVETEPLRLQNEFSDAIRGLHVFDAKVVRPALLASADVTLA